MRHLDVCYRAAWCLKLMLMQAMAEREGTRRLGGLVQIGDAYLGGKRNGGKPGPGSENKRPFVNSAACLFQRAFNPAFIVESLLFRSTTSPGVCCCKRRSTSGQRRQRDAHKRKYGTHEAQSYPKRSPAGPQQSWLT